MEQRETYATTKTFMPAPAPAGEPLPCPGCGAVIGEVREVGRGYRLYLAGSTMPVYAVHGECPECGEAVHWTGNDEFFRRRVLRR